MRFDAVSEAFGPVTYTVSKHEFAQQGYVLRSVDEAWRADGTRLNASESVRLEAELKARGLL